LTGVTTRLLGMVGEIMLNPRIYLDILKGLASHIPSLKELYKMFIAGNITGSPDQAAIWSLMDALVTKISHKLEPRYAELKADMGACGRQVWGNRQVKHNLNKVKGLLGIGGGFYSKACGGITAVVGGVSVCLYLPVEPEHLQDFTIELSLNLETPDDCGANIAIASGVAFRKYSELAGEASTLCAEADGTAAVPYGLETCAAFSGRVPNPTKLVAADVALSGKVDLGPCDFLPVSGSFGIAYALQPHFSRRRTRRRDRRRRHIPGDDGPARTPSTRRRRFYPDVRRRWW